MSIFPLATTKPSAEGEALPSSLEDLLAFLERFGKPRIGVFTNGWHASVEMHVASAGASFDIKSDFGLTSPTAATRQCAERVMATLRQMGVAT